MSSNEIPIINQRQTYNHTLKTCKESFVPVPIVMYAHDRRDGAHNKIQIEMTFRYFRKNFFLVNSINDIIGKFESGGFIKHWHFNYLNNRYSSKDAKSKRATVLTVSQMSGSLQVWIWGCGIAIACFLVEVLYKLVFNFIQKVYFVIRITARLYTY